MSLRRAAHRSTLPAGMRSSSSEIRNAGLDLLRLLAVVLVLGRHMEPCPAAISQTLHELTTVWLRGGWVGVDLFFVLSGFLISGLLFTEHAKTGSFDVKRFLIRRGMKIYPPFLLLIGITALVTLGRGKALSLRQLFGELFFLQNYLGGLWNHTWSLAVEEHFYLGFALLVHWAATRGALGRRLPSIPTLFLITAVLCLLLRIGAHLLYPVISFRKHLYGTHIRIDSLLFGVMLSYYHHCTARVRALTAAPAAPLLIAGAALLAPAFAFPVEEYWAISAFGVIAFYIGSGLLVLAVIRLKQPALAFITLLAKLGAASYSIYLWHMPIHAWGIPVVRKLTRVNHWYVDALLYYVGALAIGYCASKLIEKPALVLRNSLFPSRIEEAVPNTNLADRTAT